MRVNSDTIPEGPPWTPAVWTEGPDKLVADAEQQLWADQADVGAVLAGTDRAMGGSGTSDQNESDIMLDPADRANSGRLAQWNDSLNDMRRNEPLAAWASGAHDGPANPNA